jgi:hypothetical protein
MEARNENDGLGYSEEDLEDAASGIAKILAGEQLEPDYAFIDECLEEANKSSKRDLPSYAKERTLVEYAISNDSTASISP